MDSPATKCGVLCSGRPAVELAEAAHFFTHRRLTSLVA